jgi:predicted nucleic acid-binding protein
VTVVWALSRTEIAGAVNRLRRESQLERDEASRALRRLEKLARTWNEIDALEPVRDGAERLLRVHPLTAADALQLSAAIVAARGRSKGHAFVTADDRLAEAADAEGFDPIIPE